MLLQCCSITISFGLILLASFTEANSILAIEFVRGRLFLPIVSMKDLFSTLFTVHLASLGSRWRGCDYMFLSGVVRERIRF